MTAFKYSDATPEERAAFFREAALQVEAAGTVRLDAVEIAAVGDNWPAARSDGKTGVSITRGDLEFAVAAAESGQLPAPVVGIGHPGFDRPNGQNGSPAIGRVENLRLSDDGSKLLGDLVDVPQWAAAAYPRRSAEWWVPTSGGMVISAVKLLGTEYPAIDSLADLEAVASDRGPELVAASADLAGAVLVAAAFDAPAASTDLPPTGDENQPAAQAAGVNEEGGSHMSVDLTALRVVLGLSEDADEAAINAALAEAAATKNDDPDAPTEAAAAADEAPAEEPAPAKVEAGAVTIDPDVLAELRRKAELGEQAHAAQAAAERDRIIDAAVAEGRIFADRKVAVQAAYDVDPEGWRTKLTADETDGGLAKGLVAPVDGERGVAIEAAAKTSELTDDEIYEAVYGRQEG